MKRKVKFGFGREKHKALCLLGEMILRHYEKEAFYVLKVADEETHLPFGTSTCLEETLLEVVRQERVQDWIHCTVNKDKLKIIF